ncbi:geranylgeranyl pyrophosphate synthase [Euryarchaeota archaeon ex4484_162]|nr:MAG: geranylgeranyl pyrophosphate synthase [Euryarchaeota archaeon ex4484_162]
MNIRNELEKRADIFNKEMKKYLKTGTPKRLYDAAKHLPLAGGKRLRPCVAMLSCESVSGDVQRVMPFAVALELVHNFTLIHDDIMDKSRLRRNLPAVHIKFGESTAILAGDFLFALSFEAMQDIPIKPSVFKKLNNSLIQCVKDICQGQQLDTEFEKRKNIAEYEYLNMIQKKTASLFRLAAHGGAIIGNGSTEEINALTEYGNLLGLAFQIWDDYLDLSSSEKTLGKDIGNDIRNGKKTLIAVHALENTNNQDKKLLEEVMGNKDASERDIKQIVEVFKKTGSIEYAKKTALHYSRQAKKTLETLKDSEAKTVLIQLADYSIEREK